MATLSLTVVKGKALKDGKNRVRISVAHNSQTRYIPTDVFVTSKEWKKGQVVRRPDAVYLNTKLLSELNSAQKRLDALVYPEGMTCNEIVEAITEAKRKEFITLAEAFDEMLNESTCKETSKKTYTSLFRTMQQVIPPTTPVAAISKSKAAEVARIQGLSTQTRRNIITLLSIILNHCQRKGYTNFRELPTRRVISGHATVRHCWLTPEQVRTIRDCPVRNTAYRDLFMLSYYLGGINPVDIMKIDFRQCRHRIKYVRTKTERIEKVNPFVEFAIPDVAWPLIERLTGEDGHIALPPDHSRLENRLSYWMKIIREKTGINNLLFYSARKSFAQHAFTLGVSEGVIDYILGHSLGANKSMLYAYVQVTPEMATEAVRRVCDFISSE